MSTRMASFWILGRLLLRALLACLALAVYGMRGKVPLFRPL